MYVFLHSMQFTLNMLATEHCVVHLVLYSFNGLGNAMIKILIMDILVTFASCCTCCYCTYRNSRIAALQCIKEQAVERICQSCEMSTVYTVYSIMVYVLALTAVDT